MYSNYIPVTRNDFVSTNDAIVITTLDLCISCQSLDTQQDRERRELSSLWADPVVLLSSHWNGLLLGWLLTEPGPTPLPDGGATALPTFGMGSLDHPSRPVHLTMVIWGKTNGNFHGKINPLATVCPWGLFGCFASKGKRQRAATDTALGTRPPGLC